MSTPSAERIKQLLSEYSGHVECWMPAMGDSHEMLACRELLSEAVLTAEQAKELAELDAGVMAHVESLAPGSKGWDVEMLKNTARLIRTNESGVVQ